jgi:DNA-binding transcriptional LysR family regulator
MKKPSHDLLEVLIAVGESRNFREAASKLGISQPAVTRKIRELELSQPLPMFNLEGKRKVLTRYGRSLLDLAKEGALDLERKIEGLHRSYSNASSLTVRIAGRYEVLEFLAPLLDFEGRIELIGASSRDATDRLLRHEVDIAVGWARPDSTEIQAKKLFSSKAFLAIHESVLKQRKLTLELASSAAFLCETPSISYLRSGHLLSEWAAHAGVSFEEIPVSRVAEDWRTIATLVEQKAGYAILPGYVLPVSSKIMRIELPARILPAYDFYAMYDSSLKRIKAFQPLLAFARLGKN